MLAWIVIGTNMHWTFIYVQKKLLLFGTLIKFPYVTSEVKEDCTTKQHLQHLPDNTKKGFSRQNKNVTIIIVMSDFVTNLLTVDRGNI